VFRIASRDRGQTLAVALAAHPLTLAVRMGFSDKLKKQMEHTMLFLPPGIVTEPTRFSMRRGVAQEKISIGTFANKGDNRASLCYFRSLMDRKQNMSFSFDPQSLLCSNCPARGGHDVGEGGEGGSDTLMCCLIKISLLLFPAARASV
jgi:hypothetical protein